MPLPAMLSPMIEHRPTYREPPVSYYWAAATPPPPYPPLAGDVEADVAVIGGGFTGLSTALHLALRGVTVVLVEARRIGWGASGRNGGQVVPGYAADIRSIEASLGLDTAMALWRFGTDATDLVAELVARHRIDCALTPGFLTAAVKPAHAEDLNRLADHLARRYAVAGLRPLDRRQIAGHLGSAVYHGGLLDPSGGHLDPLALARGLATAAAGAGAQLFETSPVLRIERGDATTRLHLPGGRIRATHVVLAGNAYLGGLVPELERGIIPASTFMIATEPLDDTTTRGLIRDNVAVCDTRHALNYFRLSSDRRLLFGGGIRYGGREPDALTAMLRARMIAVFPQLAGAAIPYGWSGLVDISRNRLPQLGRLPGGLFYAQGFSGHGIALTLLAGQAIASAVAGETGRFDTLAAIPHRDFPGGRQLRAPILEIGRLWYRLLDML
ncbi:MAG TPA: FAD-binding oxidoreductase [Stellaceae bacterium]|nr:FAD-binding oxidoreductase [Stellaceae bacterium]